MKKIVYIAHVRMPSERAHSAQIAHMCGAFASAGLEVELVVPDRKDREEGSVFSYYNLPENFTITYLPTINLITWGGIGYICMLLLFSLRAAKYVQKVSPNVVYGREAMPVYFAKKGAWKTFYEVHEPRVTFLGRKVLCAADTVIVISEGVQEAVSDIRRDVIVAHDAIPQAWLMHSCDKIWARKYLGLPNDKHVAMYVGSVSSEKGVRTLCEAKKYLDDVEIAIIGSGREKEELMQTYKKVKFLGPRPYARLPEYQCAADVLVIPNSMKDANAAHYTSPLKLFAHMVSSIPIVASRVPALSSIVSDEEVIFSVPDDPKALAKGIKNALKDSRVRLQNAKKNVEIYTWEKRAEHIRKYML